MKKQTVIRTSLFLIVISLGVLGVGQLAYAKNTTHLSGRERAAQAKFNRTNRTASVPKSHKRTIPGKVVSFDGTTLVMTKGNKTYTVTTDGSTAFVDRTWKAIDKSLIVAGHKVTVKGTVTGLDVVATSVRDVSLPVKSASTTDSSTTD